ncbi:MAG: PPOX class F420-dependent oxidoreductase [Actinomycetota bacterium]
MSDQKTSMPIDGILLFVTAELDAARYIAFVSFRNDGTPVSTAVWVVPFEDGYAFTTDPDSWKIKRILKNPAVTIQASNVRGRPKRGSLAVAGHAEVLNPGAVARVRKAVRGKYRIMYRLLIERSDKKAAKKDGSATAGTAAIKVVLEG